MASSKYRKDRFDASGPIHLMRGSGGSSAMKIDWESEEHRRCIAACLVQGTYVLERDRLKRRCQAQPLAPAWYESFHFSKMEVLEVEDDYSFLSRHKGEKLIFGAIYKHVGETPRHPSAPQYVVAFRGTMPRHLKDVILDGKIVVNRLKESERSRRAHAAVDALLTTIAKKKAGLESCDVVWLAGHSLGASLALEVGRTKMAKQRLSLPAFLFNPPQVSLAPVINMLLHSKEEAKNQLYAVSQRLKAGLGLAVSPHRERMEELFKLLSPWAPKLYVHEKDIICLGFIDYFEQRERLEKEPFRGDVNLMSATTLSYRDMLLYYMLGEEKERPHLLPSATLWKNSSMDVRWFKQPYNAHKLNQWWKPDGQLSLSHKHYSYTL